MGIGGYESTEKNRYNIPERISKLIWEESSIFVNRELRQLSREFDGLSAGGRFGTFFVVCIFVAIGGISLLVGVLWSACKEERPENEELVRKFKIAARLLAGIGFAYMMLWMLMLPEYVEIYG